MPANDPAFRSARRKVRFSLVIGSLLPLVRWVPDLLKPTIVEYREGPDGTLVEMARGKRIGRAARRKPAGS